MVLGITAFWGCNPEDDIVLDPVIECDSLAVIITIETSPDSALVATVLGGTAPFSYLWSNGETGSSITYFTEGSYTVTITDDNDCTVETTIEVGGTIPVCNVNIDSVDVMNNGDDTYTFTADVSGGTVPYSYAWSNGTTGNPTTVSTTGTYLLTVTDAVGCWIDTAVFITPVIIDSCLIDVSIFPDSIGMDQVISYVYGGTPPYAYIWSDGSTGANIINPVAGTTYSVTVTDANDCSGDATHEYGDYDPCAFFYTSVSAYQDSLEINMTTLIANATGGLEPYSYLWSEGTTDHYIVVPNNSGTYSVTITDENGCENQEQINL